MWRGVSVLNRKASEMNAQVCPAYRARNCAGVAVSHATRKEGAMAKTVADQFAETLAAQV